MRGDGAPRTLDWLTSVWLFVAAFLGGALNSVAGGGAFVVLPALMSAGVGAVAANATATFAMWPGSVSSALAYHREVRKSRAWLIRMGPASLLGGVLGALLLVNTSDTRFLRVLPWLMAGAALAFTFGAPVSERLRQIAARRTRGNPDVGHAPDRAPVWIVAFQLLVAIYGGYFGGGMGIVMLAALAVTGMTDIHEMNALKITLAVAINAMALAIFIIDGTVAWAPGIVMVAGGIAGGYVGASSARRIDPSLVRKVVVVLAWVMTAVFFLRGR